MAKKQIITITDPLFAPRVYTDTELEDFHNKIQKFWDEPRTLENGQIARKFRHEDLHVAFGAARKVMSGPHPHYLYNSQRNEVFNNLWRQYEAYMQKKDWIENQRRIDAQNAEAQFGGW